MGWKKLIGTDGRTYHVNVSNVAHIIAQPDGSSWITFAGRGGEGVIGTIAVRATAAEILKGETLSS